STAKCCPAVTGTRAPTSVIGASPPVSAGICAVGPVPAEVAIALSPVGSTVMLARRNVAVAVPPSPSALMRNFVITPLIGAPCDDGSPLGAVGTMYETIVHGPLIVPGSPDGSLHRLPVGLSIRRLPKVTAALLADAKASVAAIEPRGIRSFFSTEGPFSLSG